MPLTCLRPYQKKKKVVYFDLLPVWNIKNGIGTFIRQQIVSAFLLERPQVDHDYLLVDKRHQPLNRSGLLQRVQRLSIQAGVPANSHALRRAFVIINSNKGRPLVMLQIARGHFDITTIRYLKHYNRR